MTITPAGWRRIWESLGAKTVPMGLMNQLVGAYSEAQRHYHTLQHLRECLAHLEAASSLAKRPDEVELALWFHDAVYDPQRSDNEERSALWAHTRILDAGCDAEVAERVHALVMSTRHFAAAETPTDPDTCVLLDIDLAILAAAPDRFDSYDQAIRAEYGFVPEGVWRQRRIGVLQNFLLRERIYLTDTFHAALDQRARENLQRALVRLGN